MQTIDPPVDARHPVTRFSDSAHAALGRLSGTPAWSMSPDEQRAALVELTALQARVEELRLRVLAGADRNQVGNDSGATSTGTWLAHATRSTRAGCARDLRLALALGERYRATRAALAQGRINPDQAAVVVAAVDRLTSDYDDLPDNIRPRAEAHLLELAEQYDAATLARFGMRIYEVVCPEAADRAEGELLAKQEARAREHARLSMHDNGDGTVDGRFRLPSLHADVLKKALQALTSPRRLAEQAIDPETGRRRSQPTLMGHGLMELLESHLAVGTLPGQGGSPFTMVITIPLDQLLSGLGVATVETGTRISAAEARRLACQAGLLPMVLNGESVPLDLGRERRLFTKHQRIALTHLYGGCAAETCDRPPAWAEAHHLQPWSTSGPTDLPNGISLCPTHHRMADNPNRWNMTRLPTGAVTFTRRQ